MQQSKTTAVTKTSTTATGFWGLIVGLITIACALSGDSTVASGAVGPGLVTLALLLHAGVVQASEILAAAITSRS